MLVLLMAFLLIKNRKLRLLIALTETLCVIYFVFIHFCPIWYAADDENSKSPDNNTFAVKMIDGYLHYQCFSINGMLKEYHINSAEVLEFKGIKYIKSDFDVKPRIKALGYDGWLAGNGVEGKDGWIKNKVIFFEYAKVGDIYIITNSKNTGL